MEAMQNEARANGANAIVIMSGQQVPQSFVTANPQFGLIGGSSNEKNLIAVAIRLHH